MPKYDSLDNGLAGSLGDNEPILSDAATRPGDRFSHLAELPEPLKQIKEIIDCLLRLSVTLSNPVPHDQFRSRVGVETTQFYPNDIKYVQETFPSLDSAISQRLAMDLNRRRQHIKYCADRHQGVKKPLGLDQAEHARNDDGGTTGLSPIPENMHDSTPTDVTISKRPASETSATSHDRSNIMDPSEARIPPLPKQHTDGQILCPFCFMLISVKDEDEWE